MSAAHVRAAQLATIGFVGLALFQLILAAGVPWGRAAWGGADPHLSTAQRIGSAAAVVVWTAAALIVLGRAGLVRAGRPARLFRSGTWFVATLLGISALMNFASQSRWENLIFGPLALLLAILCTIVARSATDEAAPKSHGLALSTRTPKAAARRAPARPVAAGDEATRRCRASAARRSPPYANGSCPERTAA